MFKGSDGNCDASPRGEWKGVGWYRLMEPAGTKIPEQPPPRWNCGTIAAGWLTGSHPTEVGESVERGVCFNNPSYGLFGHWTFGRHKCYGSWPSKLTITVTYCSGYYVYDLPSVGCDSRYCAA